MKRAATYAIAELAKRPPMRHRRTPSVGDLMKAATDSLEAASLLDTPTGAGVGSSGSNGTAAAAVAATSDLHVVPAAAAAAGRPRHLHRKSYGEAAYFKAQEDEAAPSFGRQCVLRSLLGSLSLLGFLL